MVKSTWGSDRCSASSSLLLWGNEPIRERVEVNNQQLLDFKKQKHASETADSLSSKHWKYFVSSLSCCGASWLYDLIIVEKHLTPSLSAVSFDVHSVLLMETRRSIPLMQQIWRAACEAAVTQRANEGRWIIDVMFKRLRRPSRRPERILLAANVQTLKVMCHSHRSLRQSFIHDGVTAPCVRWIGNVRLLFEFFVNGHIFTTVELNLFKKTDFVLMKVIFLFVKSETFWLNLIL